MNKLQVQPLFSSLTVKTNVNFGKYFCLKWKLKSTESPKLNAISRLGNNLEGRAIFVNTLNYRINNL